MPMSMVFTLMSRFAVDNLQLRVETRAGVCGTDTHFVQGDEPLPQPAVLGHEGLGRIVELGEGVTTDHASNPIAVGDVVYWNPIMPCNACYDCTISEDFTACTNRTFWSPANQAEVRARYTELATLLLPYNSFYRINPSVPLDSFIAMGCALPTILRALDHLGGILSASTAVVQGAGPVRLAAIMMAKLAHASHIVSIDRVDARLQRAKDFGAALLIDIRKPELSTREARRSYTDSVVGARGVGLVIECSGNPAAFEEGIGMLARSGKNVPFCPFEVVQKALTVVGSTFASPKHYYRAARLVEANHERFPLTQYVTHKYKLHDTEEALRAVGAGEVVKAVISP
ncbi:putative alcohol dehydrogenase [Ilyonectria destructans]|nr:putative alcohol dehydrogenase [Ilyonectria destructans]